MDLLIEAGKILFGGIIGFSFRLILDRKSQKREKEEQEINEIKEDQRVLQGVLKILLEIERIYKSSKTPRPLIEIMDELFQLSAGLKREENRTIRNELLQFSARYRENPSHGPESKEMRREAEKLKRKLEEILGIVDD